MVPCFHAAINAVRNEGMAYATAAKNFNVSRKILKRRVLNKNKDAVGNKKVGLLGKFRTIFNENQEEELLNHLPVSYTHLQQ